MMFAWTNSYNKQVKFKCVVGAYINNTGSVMISGEVGSWVRKHTGTADTETNRLLMTISLMHTCIIISYVLIKLAMEVISLNKRKQSQLLGILFAEYEILTTEQASMIRDQMKRPLHVFKIQIVYGPSITMLLMHYSHHILKLGWKIKESCIISRYNL
jgi:hypothetical protein